MKPKTKQSILPKEKLSKARREELRLTLSKMEAASSTFYVMAQHAGSHPFLELCGFMNEYIQICQNALNAGIDFTESNKHAGATKLPIQTHEAAYLGEKFGCIFETTFSGRPDLLRAFLNSAELGA
jgi:hypothetical protein